MTAIRVPILMIIRPGQSIVVRPGMRSYMMKKVAPFIFLSWVLVVMGVRPGWRSAIRRVSLSQRHLTYTVRVHCAGRNNRMIILCPGRNACSSCWYCLRGGKFTYKSTFKLLVSTVERCAILHKREGTLPKDCHVSLSCARAAKREWLDVKRRTLQWWHCAVCCWSYGFRFRGFLSFRDFLC